MSVRWKPVLPPSAGKAEETNNGFGFHSWLATKATASFWLARPRWPSFSVPSKEKSKTKTTNKISLCPMENWAILKKNFIYSHFRNALRFHLECKRFRVCQLRMRDSRSFWKKALSSGSKLSSLRVTCRSRAARKSSLAPLFTPRVTALLKDRMDQV